MDLLAVDQSNGESRIAVVEHIPMICSKARLTIVIREAGGLHPCCADMVAKRYRERLASSSPNLTTELSVAGEHVRNSHPGGLREQWMERVWPLQVLHLSDTLLFAACDPSEENLRSEHLWPLNLRSYQSKKLK
jgi:hypothetical protein